MTNPAEQREGDSSRGHEFTNLADRLFALATNQEGVSYKRYSAEGGRYAGEEREEVMYTTASDTTVTLWRVADPAARSDSARVVPFMEYWINREDPILLVTTPGVIFQRYNFHIGGIPRGDFLESPETLFVSPDILREALRPVIDNIDEIELPDEPYNLGFSYWPLDDRTTTRVLEDITPDFIVG